MPAMQRLSAMSMAISTRPRPTPFRSAQTSSKNSFTQRAFATAAVTYVGLSLPGSPALSVLAYRMTHATITTPIAAPRSRCLITGASMRCSMAHSVSLATRHTCPRISDSAAPGTDAWLRKYSSTPFFLRSSSSMTNRLLRAHGSEP